MEIETIGLREGSDLVSELLRRVQGEDGRWWANETYKLFAGALTDKPTPIPSQVIKVVIGGHRNVVEFREDFVKISEKKKIAPGKWALDLMESPQFVLLGGSAEVEVAILTPKEMGFTEQPMLRDIYRRATLIWKLGLCRPEVGPALRLKQRQSPGERILIGMQPIIDSEKKTRSFVVERDTSGVELLDAAIWKSKHLYGLKEQFAFELHPGP